MEEDKKMRVLSAYRKSDGKLVVLKDLLEHARKEGVQEDAIYPYRQSEEQEKPTAWVHGKELKIWLTPEVEEAMKKLSWYEGEKKWRRGVLDSIEPGMTAQRANELKITQQVKLLDECYQILMDGKPIGPTYPMPPGMLNAIMWGKPTEPKEDI